MRRYLLLAACGVIAAAAAPALAETSTASPTTPDRTICIVISDQVPHCVDTSGITNALPGEYHVGPVTVIDSTANGGLDIGATFNGEPVAGVTDNNGEVCVGISLELPLCATAVSVGPLP